MRKVLFITAVVAALVLAATADATSKARVENNLLHTTLFDRGGWDITSAKCKRTIRGDWFFCNVIANAPRLPPDYEVKVQIYAFVVQNDPLIVGQCVPAHARVPRCNFPEGE